MRIVIALSLLVSLITGCTHPRQQFQFSHFVPGTIERITVRNGAGVTYSTSDRATIDDFIKVMNSKVYEKANDPGLVGSSQLMFYGPDGKELCKLAFVGDYLYNGQNYYGKLPSHELQKFYQELQADDQQH